MSMSRIAAFTLSIVLLTLSQAGAADHVTAPYNWRNVKVGGGGYIPGLIFSPVEKGLAYLRSDMGGIYRWDDKAKTWLPLQDDQAETSYRGVESLAPDPVDANTVYAAVGVYRGAPAAILRSSNRGDSWDIVPVPFRMGGNEEGRSVGERLAVDPNNTAILYFGSRYDGLQRSMDHGKTWEKVTRFPYAGLGLAPQDSRPYAGLSFVVFDPKSANKATGSKTLFVGVADAGPHHLFRSNDAGKSWAPVAGEPAATLLPEQAQLDAKGVLTITYANSAGPWAVTDGAVFKLDIKSGVWTDITPEKGPTKPKGGYSGLSLDRQHTDTLVVASSCREGDDIIWRSTDGGAHWQDIRALSTRDVSSVPFLYWGEKQASFGWWMSGLAIDPFDSGHIAYTTGATVYGTHQLLNAEAKKPVVWMPWVDGIEQTAVITLVSPAKGVPLISGFGDIGGFVHSDLTKSMPITAGPMFTNTNTIDYAEAAPNVIVRSGTRSQHNHPSASLAYSTDFGTNWAALKAPLPTGYVEIPDGKLGYNYGDPYIDANIVVSADGKTFVVMTPEPVLTDDRGTTWSKVKGLPAHHGWIVADRADSKRFYAVDFETAVVYASVDGARSFKSMKTTGLPSAIKADEPKRREDIQSVYATPNKPGDLWFNAQGQLYHSTDGGLHFAKIDSGLTVSHMDFGKAAPGKTDMALYAIGTKGTVTAIWQSLDNAQSWTRINDGRHEYFRAFRRIAADKNIFGRVYVATDGRGIVLGEPSK